MKGNKFPCITIMTDGKVTTAIMEDGKRFKVGHAICHAKDPFDFIIGAEIAFDRLLGRTTSYDIGELRAFYEDKLAEKQAEIDRLQELQETNSALVKDNALKKLEIERLQRTNNAILKDCQSQEEEICQMKKKIEKQDRVILCLRKNF